MLLNSYKIVQNTLPNYLIDYFRGSFTDFMPFLTSQTNRATELQTHFSTVQQHSGIICPQI